MNEPNNAHRQGDVWVPCSRRWADFEDYLLTRQRCKDIRNNGRPRVAIKPGLNKYPAQRSEELHRELTTANRMISRGKLQNAQIENGELKFSRDRTFRPKGMEEFTKMSTSR